MILVSDKCAKSHFQVSREVWVWSEIPELQSQQVGDHNSQSWSTAKVAQGRITDPRLLHYSNDNNNYYTLYYYHDLLHFKGVQGWMVFWLFLCGLSTISMCSCGFLLAAAVSFCFYKNIHPVSLCVCVICLSVPLTLYALSCGFSICLHLLIDG